MPKLNETSVFFGTTVSSCEQLAFIGHFN